MDPVRGKDEGLATGVPVIDIRHAAPLEPGSKLEVWPPEALLRAFLDAVADRFVRGARGAAKPSSQSAISTGPVKFS